MKRRNKWLYIVLGLFIITYLSYKFYQSYATSLFSSKRNRINFVVYGQSTAFYSVDKAETRHYMMYFYPDLKMQIPGGYDDYRVGSLGKLAKLDKKPDILRKTFAVATTSFVTHYFYPHAVMVYYGTKLPTKPKKPKLRDIWFMSSNASILDRLYISLIIFDKKDDDFHIIAYQSEKNTVQDDIFFEDNSFIKNSIGLLFQGRYRDEQKNIQIQYRKNYTVAAKLSSLLEGNGIRVNDLTLDMEKRKNCLIIENSRTFSETAKDLASYFGCPLSYGKTDVYDIIFVLGEVEHDWEIN